MTSRIKYNNPESNGAFGLPYHYELLADQRRILPFKRAVLRATPGQRVLESGAGSGILSLLAARAGAKVVYAVERDPRIAAFLRENVQKSGYEHVIRLIEADVRDLRIEDIDNQPVDVILAENLSTWQVTEPQLSILNHINQHLASPSAIRIPERVHNTAQLVCSRYRLDDLVELRTLYFGFTGIPKPLVMSRPTLFRTVHFGAVNSTTVEGELRLVATKTGVINGLRLTSPLKVLDEISFKSSDSLMPPVIVPLPHDLEVSEGDTVEVHFRYRCETDWREFACDAACNGERLSSRHASASHWPLAKTTEPTPGLPQSPRSTADQLPG